MPQKKILKKYVFDQYSQLSAGFLLPGFPDQWGYIYVTANPRASFMLLTAAFRDGSAIV